MSQRAMSPSTAELTEEAIRSWLVDRVASYLDLPPASVVPDRLLTELGVDSIYGLTLCGDIEDRFGLAVDATLAWDYPTVDAITGYLRAALAARG